MTKQAIMAEERRQETPEQRAGIRRYAFLLCRRWIGLILIVAVLVTLFGFLARWQLGRNDERSIENARIEAAMQSPPKPIEEVLGTGRVGASTEYRNVTIRGRYDAGRQLLVRFRHYEGEPGWEVVAPLITEQGRAVLVDRGWIPGRGAGTKTPQAPPLPTGRVQVTGRIRAPESGNAAQGRPKQGQVRFIDTEGIASTLPYDLYDGFVELTAQRPNGPSGAKAPRPLPEPELDAGPFLSYGIQWYLFGGIALIGLGILAYDEAHSGKLARRWNIKR